MKACLLGILMFASAVSAQTAAKKSQGDEKVTLVPVKVHQKFVIENPDTRAVWKAGNGVYTAQYINPLNNMGYLIVYDSAANILRREKELENNDYPPLINDFFTREFPGEGYVIWSSVDSAGRLHYYSSHNARMLMFDRQGNPLNPKRKAGSADSILAPARPK